VPPMEGAPVGGRKPKIPAPVRSDRAALWTARAVPDDTGRKLPDRASMTALTSRPPA
jgi:hypothetical protein